MRGRKKNRAEKYDPKMTLSELYTKSGQGRFEDEGIWGYILEHMGVQWDENEDPDFNREFYQKHPEHSPKNMILEWCRILIETRNADGFLRISEMMKAAMELEASGQNVMDPQRNAILKANDDIYFKISESKDPGRNPKKAELIKHIREWYGELFEDMDQSDILKMMRGMGIPRRPSYLTKGYAESIRKEIAAFRRKKGGK